ncbi:hypothetical protein Tco_1432187 [Tanacetum coccineum]
MTKKSAVMNVEGLKMVKGNLYKAGYEVKDGSVKKLFPGGAFMRDAYRKTSGKVKDVYVRKDAKVSNVVEEQKKASDDGVILNEKMIIMNVEGLKMVKGNLYKAGYEVKD